jgi:hypothetical protein
VSPGLLLRCSVVRGLACVVWALCL